MAYNRYLNNVIRKEHLQALSVSKDKLDGEQKKTLIFEYDFADLGGSQGAITLTDENDVAQTLPSGAIITECLCDTLIPFASGGSATVALGITGNTDAFIGATAYNNSGFLGVTTKNSEVPLKTGSAVSVLLTVATADLTAGQIRLHITYI